MLVRMSEHDINADEVRRQPRDECSEVMSALLICNLESNALFGRSLAGFQCAIQLDTPQSRVVLPRRTTGAARVLQITRRAVGEMNQPQAPKILQPRAEPQHLVVRMRGNER